MLKVFRVVDVDQKETLDDSDDVTEPAVLLHKLTTKSTTAYFTIIPYCDVVDVRMQSFPLRSAGVDYSYFNQTRRRS